MKHFFIYVIIYLLFSTHHAIAQGMVKKADIHKTYLSVVGIPDYPPFSYYEKFKNDGLQYFELKSVFLKPLLEISSKRNFEMKAEDLRFSPNIKNLIIETKDGLYDVFIGAYTDTKLFKGLNLIYPASVANPIHVITLPSDDIQIKKSSDLMKYKGIVIKSEYFSDFVLRKIKQLNISFVETPYEAYEMLFTGQAQYIIGGIYYNKIMASRLGIEQYLSFSTKPLFNIPVFIAISQMMKFSEEYANMFQKEFSNEKFASEVKKEILRMINEELEKNVGIVPPSFAQKKIEEPVAIENDENKNNSENLGGTIIQKNLKTKSIDEVLEGI